MDMVQVGVGANSNVETQVDPSGLASRMSLRPLEWTGSGRTLGHYRMTFVTGTTVSISAGGLLAYLRWTDPSSYAVLLRIDASVAVSAAITAATVADLAAFVGRGSTAAGSGGNAMSVAGNNQKNRGLFGSSLVADARVATTGALTRPTTATADAAPFAASAFQTKVSPDIGATASATVAVGVASPVVNLYKPDALAQHPIVLQASEHVEVQELTAGPVTGGLKWYITLEWAEVPSF